MSVADRLSEFLKRLRWWFPATARWIPELIGFFAPYVAPVLIVLLLCVVVRMFWPCHAQQAIRWIGGGFQLVGVITIVLKLHAAQQQFSQHTLKRILERRPRFWQQNTVISAAGTSISTASGSVRGRAVAGSQATLEQRVAILEDSHTKLFDEVGSLGNEVKRRSDELASKLHDEATAREAADKGIKEQLKETAVGSIHLDVWGVVFVVSGIVAGTASPEIAAWVGGGSCG
ncbi:MAG TPA: hypothetical protein VNY10_02510 [Roseiarcus sp.]|nr:hypothetical protein [Roseiarcus sp.]